MLVDSKTPLAHLADKIREELFVGATRSRPSRINNWQWYAYHVDGHVLDRFIQEVARSGALTHDSAHSLYVGSAAHIVPLLA